MGSQHPRTESSTAPAHRSEERFEPTGRTGETDADRLLQAERAAAAYWRSVAEDRRAATAATQRRPLVRAAIAIDRESQPLQGRVIGAARTLRRWWSRTHLRLLALRSRPSTTWRRRRLHSQVQVADRPPAASGRKIDVLVVDLDRAAALGPADLADRGRHESILDPDTRTEILADEVNRLVERCRPDAICILAAHAEPASSTWIQRLGDALTAEVAVAVPTLMHPERPGARTPHDLLTRSRGLAVETIAGAPRPRSVGAGRPADASAEHLDPVAATSTCLAVDGDAWRAVGGLTAGLDADAATIDLCLRIGGTGRRIRHVPEVLITDRRPVFGIDDLRCEIRADGPTWRSIVDRHGPSLRRQGGSRRMSHEGNPEAPEPFSMTITTAVPSAKLTHRWGDWPFASAIAAALRRAGHPVLLQTLDRVDDPASRAADIQLVIRGLAPVHRVPGQRHVLWVISHPESVTVEEMDAADLVLVASTRFAEHVAPLTSTPVEVLLQATDPAHFALRDPEAPRPHDVLVVANSRGVRRRVVADADEAGIRYSLVGSGWEDLVVPDRIVATHVDHDDLPRLYAGADLVLNDHWDTMAHWGFVSNRVLDVLACGTPVASDHVPELAQLFGDLVPTWRGPEELAAIVEGLRERPDAAEERALAARDLVLEHHTFDHRARELLDHLTRHGLTPAAPAT